MYCTNVQELCSAIQHIEKNDLVRVLEKVGGKVTFPIDNTPHIELYSNGPCSPGVAAVEVSERYDQKHVLLHCPELDAVIDSKYVYPGHLSMLTAHIIQTQKKN